MWLLNCEEYKQLSKADQLLLHSAWLNDSRGCKEAFEDGANPNASQEHKVTAAHIAAEKGFPEFMAALIECSRKKGKRLDLNATTIFGSTPLALAITADKLEVITQLLEAGADPNIKHTFGRTPLHIAAYFGSVRAVGSLLQHRAKVNVVDCFDQTPLSLSLISSNSGALVKLLISYGADPNFRTKSSLPILSLAVLSCTRVNELKNIQLIIKAGADINARDAIKHDTALHKAAITGYTKAIELLIKKGASTQDLNIYGQTPLQVAIKFKNIEAVTLFHRIEEELDEQEFAKLNRNSRHTLRKSRAVIME